MQLQHVISIRPVPTPMSAQGYPHPPLRCATTLADSPAPAEMNLDDLVQHSIAAVEEFYQGRTHDTRFAYELFRRALVERDEQAWEHVFHQYRGLVEHWVRRSSTFARSDESSEFFVVAAFIRFWRAISPERFAAFPTLVSLLYYLRRCAECAVIDSTRGAGQAELLPHEVVSPNTVSQRSSDEEVMERMSRIEFWRYVTEQMNDEAERVVVYYSYVMGMKPADIRTSRPDLFQDVGEVYTVKRRVLARLRRNEELRYMLA